MTLVPILTAAAADGIRLINVGDCNAAAGRLEVQVDGEWSTVCYRHFDARDSRVVCKQLGFIEGNVGRLYYSSSFPRGTRVVHMGNVNCYGHEESLTACPHTQGHRCGDNGEVGVDCENAGAVESYQWNGKYRNYSQLLTTTHKLLTNY